MVNKRDTFTEDDMRAFEPTEKIGLVASMNPNGQPHITLITTMQATNPKQLILGQFSIGLSKQYIQENNNIAFLIMTLDRSMWRGKARWTHLAKDGPEYEMLNKKPMFRYNTYFGINTIHYLDLIETSERESLPMTGIILAALITKLSKGGAQTGIEERILNPFAEGIFNQLDSLKFISYIGDDGYPVLIPLIQCQAADSRRLAFSPLVYGEELRAIPQGKDVAVFGMTMKMEDILIRGTFCGFKSRRFIELGTIDIEWVYNSMPPAHGQIYPEVEIKPVTHF
jgi:uncharacterized pyridoxamine 5'-phosphate oxidase family protein